MRERFVRIAMYPFNLKRLYFSARFWEGGAAYSRA